MSKITQEWPAAKIRQTFINYFVNKQKHTFVPSSSVIPNNDPTLLFTNAGMNQFKSILLGNIDPSSKFSVLKKAANSQKCIRAGGKHNDLDDAGKDTYHHTFFEMLGNWSFGDYFKKEAIDFAWDLLTNVYKLDKNRLYVTYFGGCKELNLDADFETKKLWKSYLAEARILPFDKKDNFWEMGASGPCGPCTEIHYDFIGDRDASALVNADDPGVIELWNLVFVQFNRLENGSLEGLPAKHVDTGMGLERLAAILQKKRSNYDTDLFHPLFSEIQKATEFETPYRGVFGDSDTAKIDNSYRIVADHIRCLCIAITDGVIPDSNGAGYVIRRILRRAVRAGRIFNETQKPFLFKLVDKTAEIFSEAFPKNFGNTSSIENAKSIILEEENNFLLTLKQGESHLNKIAKKCKKSSQNKISGQDSFTLYSSYGYPIDLTVQAAAEMGLGVDLDGFKKAKEADRSVSRDAGKNSGGKTVSLTPKEISWLETKGVKRTDFSLVYNNEGEKISCLVEAIYVPGVGFVDKVDEAEGSDALFLVLNRTAFYSEMGGQIYDTGRFEFSDGEFAVKSVKSVGGYILHTGELKKGGLSVGQEVHGIVDYKRRKDVSSNHTSTHILNLAVRNVLGEGIAQKGSRVQGDKFTFDFNSKAVKLKDVENIEKQSGAKVAEDLSVYCSEVPLKKATEIKGVRAAFGETYPDPVRVVSLGISVEDALKNPKNDDLMNFSIELCGGTHVKKTSESEEFCILSETGIAKGVRRFTCATRSVAKTARMNGETRLEEYENAKQMDYKNLSSFIKESQSKEKHVLMPYVVSKTLEAGNKALFKKLKTLLKAKEAKSEEILMQKIKDLKLNVGEGIDKSEKGEKKSSKNGLIVHKKTVCAIFIEEISTAKAIQKAAKVASGEESLSAVIISPIEDKKGNTKLQYGCFVPKSKEGSVTADLWVKKIAGKLGGSGNGKAEYAKGMCELQKIDLVVLKELAGLNTEL